MVRREVVPGTANRAQLSTDPAIDAWDPNRQQPALVFVQAGMAVAQGCVPGDVPCLPDATHLQVRLSPLSRYFSFETAVPCAEGLCNMSREQ